MPQPAIASPGTMTAKNASGRTSQDFAAMTHSLLCSVGYIEDRDTVIGVGRSDHRSFKFL
jgi:hypothetical protein